MTDTTAAIEELLAQAERAHGAYEAKELNGVYDEQWPRWYAAYAVDHGINDLLAAPVDAEELARILDSSWDELQRADSESARSWSAFVAARLAARP